MFRKIKIRTTLSIMVLSLTALLLFVGMLGLFAAQSGNHSFARVDKEVLPGLVALNESSELLLRARLDLRLYESLMSNGSQDAATVALKRAKGKIDEWQEYLTYPQAEQEKAISTEMASKRETLMTTFITPALAALEAGNLDEYRQHAGKSTVLYADFDAAAKKLVQFKRQNIDDAYTASNASINRMEIMLTVAIALALVLALLAWLVMTHLVVKPLNQAIVLHKAICALALKCRVKMRSRNCLVPLSVCVTGWRIWCVWCVTVPMRSALVSAKLLPAISISPAVLSSRPHRWMKRLQVWSRFSRR